MKTVQNLNIEEILCLDDKDPNISITNLYNNINYLLTLSLHGICTADTATPS